MSTLAWGCAALALCVLLGVMIGWPIGHARGLKQAEEEAAWKLGDAQWVRNLRAEEAERPPVPDAPRAGPGKHRHPGGPPQHAAGPAPLPLAGYLPVPDDAALRSWTGTITVPLPAPVGPAPWDRLPPEPEQTAVLEPTAVLPPPDPCSDSAWTRRMAEDMDAWIAEHITGTDAVLREITR